MAYQAARGARRGVMDVAEDWTDDMTFPIGSGATMRQLASFLWRGIDESIDVDTLCREARAQFMITVQEAELALARAFGGVVRGVTANPSNRPDALKDPIAAYTFDKVWRSLPRKFLIFGPRVPGGKWLRWWNSRRDA